MKLWVKNTILAVILVPIIAVPLLFMGGHEFGSDDQASDAISELDESYEPWFEPFWEPPSGEIESLFFCLQAGVGAGIVGFVLGRVTAKKKNDN